MGTVGIVISENIQADRPTCSAGLVTCLSSVLSQVERGMGTVYNGKMWFSIVGFVLFPGIFTPVSDLAFYYRGHWGSVCETILGKIIVHRGELLFA